MNSSSSRRGSVRPSIGASVALALTGLMALTLTACGGSVATGQGSPASQSTTMSQPSPSAAGGSSAPGGASTTSNNAATNVSALATASLTAKIRGTGAVGGSYQMSLWAHDVITDCGAHSYGQQIIGYFAAHPCRSATRRLWTTPVSGRTLALSVVSVSAQITKVNENPDFQYAQQLVDLENADGTGSVKDLLRDGQKMPGATSIPANEVFAVDSQDGLVVIIDAWYLTGATSPNDATLKNIVADLAFSDASAPDA